MNDQVDQEGQEETPDAQFQREGEEDTEWKLYEQAGEKKAENIVCLESKGTGASNQEEYGAKDEVTYGEERHCLSCNLGADIIVRCEDEQYIVAEGVQAGRNKATDYTDLTKRC